VSDASQGPGWWQASDGKWYPPESHPSAMTNPAPADPWAASASPTDPTTPTGPTTPAGPTNPTTPTAPGVGPDPRDQAGYAQPGSAQVPYGQAPGQASGPAPYGQAPYGQAAYGQPAAGQAPYGQAAYGQPAYGQAPYGQAPYGQGPGYPVGAGGYGFGPPKTNGMAVASLVLGILGFICFLGAICGGVAIILGISARKKIRESGGAEKGDGLALAGIILGAVFVVLQIGFFALALTGSSNNSTNNDLVRPAAHVLTVAQPG
jgi:hypothetical protein